jgi:hypothetical protein
MLREKQLRTGLVSNFGMGTGNRRALAYTRRVSSGENEWPVLITHMAPRVFAAKNAMNAVDAKCPSTFSHPARNTAAVLSVRQLFLHSFG